MSRDLNKKFKRPKKKIVNTTHPETSTSRNRPNIERHLAKHACPLLAKDSEWVDILQASDPGPAPSKSSNNGDSSDEEEVLQLVECEDGPQSKPLAIMFPGLLDKDPQTLNGMLNRAMSTTEVTRQLVDLGQKANFTFMKKTDRLIPTDKQWLEGVKENGHSAGSLDSSGLDSGGCFSGNYEVNQESSVNRSLQKNKKTIGNPILKSSIFLRDTALLDDKIIEDPKIT